MPDIDKDEYKDAVKQALKEWLNEQFAAFGKWTLMGLLSAAFAGLVGLWMASHGWVTIK